MTERIKPIRRHTIQEVKISKEKIDAILADIADDSTYYHACLANGIDYSTFYRWVQQAKCDLKYGIESLHSYLGKALGKIEQKEVKCLKKKIKAHKKGHKGSEWVLERCYWKQFSSNVEAIQLAEEMELDKGVNYESEKEEAPEEA